MRDDLGVMGPMPFHQPAGLFDLTAWDRANNPLLVKWFECRERVQRQRASIERDGTSPFVSSSNERQYLIRTYGFAVPTMAALCKIAWHSPNGLIEFGAGSGYWASLLHKIGINPVTAVEPFLGEQNAWKFTAAYYPLMSGPYPLGELMRSSPTRTLFLCWPNYTDPWSAETLKAYRGAKVVYIGESAGGCTASDEFFEILEREWLEIDEHQIPQWFGVNDHMWVYERRNG